MHLALDVLGFTDSVSCARVGPVFVVHYVGALSLDDLAALHRARTRFPRLDRTAILGLIEPSVPLPSGDVLRRATAMTRLPAATNVVDATVLLGGGVRAAGARQMVQRIFSRSRPYPTKIFGDIPSGCAWLAEHFPDDDGLSFALELALGDLRQSRPRGSEPDLPSEGRPVPTESGFPSLEPKLDASRERFADWPDAPAPLHSFVDELLRGEDSDDLPTPKPRPRRRR